MKKVYYFLGIIVFFISCSNEKECCIDTSLKLTVNFTHNWDGVPISASDFNQFKFITAHGESVSIQKLRYLISNFSLGAAGNYQLINVTENTGININILDLKPDNYKLSFTFGFQDSDNLDGVYQDLNAVNFNVPNLLGGGYHYMQFDGKYKDSNSKDANFNYHAIRAVDRTDPNKLIFKDTSFKVELGTINLKLNTTIEIKMNVAEWFKNPNLWNLNELNTVLMPNFEAQKLISQNGKNVFSLGSVINQ